MKTQIGGEHYSGMAIQPTPFSMHNDWDCCAHAILQYVSRHRQKGGRSDLEKARHFIGLRLALMNPCTRPIVPFFERIQMADYIAKNDIRGFAASALEHLEEWVYTDDPACSRRLDRALRELIEQHYGSG